MPEFMDIPLGGQELVGQLDEELWATTDGAEDQVVQRVAAAARSMK